MRSNPSSVRRPESGGANQPAAASSAILIGLGGLVLLFGAVYLFKTNPAAGKWTQSYDPTGRWWLSTIAAALPVIVLLGAMAVLRLKAHVAAAIGLLTALVVAMAVYQMPLRLAFTTTAYGAGYGLFPIC